MNGQYYAHPNDQRPHNGRTIITLLLVCGLTLLVGCTRTERRASDHAQATVVEVTQIIEVSAETEPQTVTHHITVVVTATPVPRAPASRIMVVCLGAEPSSLAWFDSNIATVEVLEAIHEPLVDSRSYALQANLVERLPSLEERSASLEAVTVSEGEVIFDVSSDRMLTLTSGMTETFALVQLDGSLVEVEAYEGEPLTTLQLTARWILVDGLRWEDGVAVTADDSVFAYEVARHPSYPGQDRYLAERTAAYTALDERTIEWKGLPGYRDHAYAANIWNPQPRHVYGNMSVPELLESDHVNRQPLGYGPYLLEEWVAGDHIVLIRNAAYVKGPPPLDSLLLRFVPETQQIAMATSGDCDVSLLGGAAHSYLPVLRHFEAEGVISLVEEAGTVFEHLDFNTLPAEDYTGAASRLQDNEGERLFTVPRFHQAIAHCIDRPAIIKSAIHGGGALQHSYTASNHPLNPGNERLITYETNPARGLELLAELGWSDSDGNSVLDNGAGEELRFIYSTYRSSEREQIAQIVQAQLKENCLIETEIELMGLTFFDDGPTGPIFGRRYDLAGFAWFTAVEPPCNLYLSAQIPSEENGWGAPNNTGYSNPAFDAACTAALQAMDADERAEQHAAAMRLFTQELPSIPLYSRTKLAIVRPGVTGVILDPTANADLWNIEAWSINTEE